MGYGRNKEQVLIKLRKFNQLSVVVELDVERARNLENDKYLVVQGTATDDAVLEKSGIHNAKSLTVAVTSNVDDLPNAYILQFIHSRFA